MKSKLFQIWSIYNCYKIHAIYNKWYECFHRTETAASSIDVTFLGKSHPCSVALQKETHSGVHTSVELIADERRNLFERERNYTESSGSRLNKKRYYTVLSKSVSVLQAGKLNKQIYFLDLKPAPMLILLNSF